MRTRSLVPLVIFLGVVACPAVATAPVPRKSPDLAINLPSGKRTQISSLKGKVILIEFLITTCPHCLRMAQTIGKLDSEMGRQGFQPFAIAFDSDVSSRKAADYAQLLNVPFPVGYTTSGNVDSYLGRAPAERVGAPQIVVIDRKGVIRAQSRPVGEKNLDDETYLRKLISGLLNEGGPGQ